MRVKLLLIIRTILSKVALQTRWLGGDIEKPCLGRTEGGIVVTNMKESVGGDDCAGDQMDGTTDVVKDEC